MQYKCGKGNKSLGFYSDLFKSPTSVNHIFLLMQIGSHLKATSWHINFVLSAVFNKQEGIKTGRAYGN